MTLIQLVSSLLTDALIRAFPELPPLVEITPATDPKFGHYQCNSAMKLSKSLKKNPREVAEKLVGALADSEKIFEKVEIAGPGFINLTLSSLFLSKKLNEALHDPRLGVPKMPPERVVVEFSSPNIAKEMHVGHLRSTIIGDAIARLFEFLGYDVLRVNHVGDWGTAFGMLIAFMQEEVPQVLSGEQKTDLPSLMGWYRASKKRFDDDAAFKERARKAVVKLQGGDPESLKAWGIICEISRRAYQEVYDLLDVKIAEKGESFYNPMLPGIVEELDQKGLLKISEGAKCVFHEGIEIPLMVQKTDGGYNYDTTDMAAMKYRVETEKAKRIIVVVDAGQSLHFELVRKSAEKAGILPPSVRFDHVPFGVVLGADGKKFRTRSGETERLIDLIHTSVREAKILILAREHGENIDELAKVLGIDAIKYADLSGNRVQDYTFSYDRMLKFEGNTATFILYSFVRIEGIKRKVQNVDFETLKRTEKMALTHPCEIDLGVHLLRFPDTISAFANDLYPHYLTDYLYNLALKFNIFFRDCRVEGSEEQSSRLLLCEMASTLMRTGLNILGLKTVERM
jgi:arginyl-tRNA synthetase